MIVILTSSLRMLAMNTAMHNFAISGKSLRTNTEFDYETASEHRLLIEVKDRRCNLQQEVLVKIEDSNDAPTGLSLDTQ